MHSHHLSTPYCLYWCKPRATSHDCSAGMTNASDCFRAQITHLYLHTTIHSYMEPRSIAPNTCTNTSMYLELVLAASSPNYDPGITLKLCPANASMHSETWFPLDSSNNRPDAHCGPDFNCQSLWSSSTMPPNPSLLFWHLPVS